MYTKQQLNNRSIVTGKQKWQRYSYISDSSCLVYMVQSRLIRLHTLHILVQMFFSWHTSLNIWPLVCFYWCKIGSHLFHWRTVDSVWCPQYIGLLSISRYQSTNSPTGDSSATWGLCLLLATFKCEVTPLFIFLYLARWSWKKGRKMVMWCVCVTLCIPVWFEWKLHEYSVILCTSRSE